MLKPSTTAQPARLPAPAGGNENGLSPEHFLRVLLHRKFLVLCVFLAIAVTTVVVSYELPDVFRSDTVILVDPQRIPESYVKPTVTGDVRDRLGTLSQQILSATRLQKIIETLNLYPEDRKKLAREEVISKMRKDISVAVVSDFGGSQDLQAFRIVYSGRNPRLVAQVANELASLFIEENLKAREQQATGTTQFLQSRLEEARKTLETQEGKLKDFKLNHIGEMPEQQAADIQILGQMQSQLQLESDALSRAEQQKSYLQSMMAQSTVVVDLDSSGPPPMPSSEVKNGNSEQTPNELKVRLAKLLTRYTDKHPEVQKLRKEIAEQEAKAAAPGGDATAGNPALPSQPPASETAASTASATAASAPRVNRANPVLESQLRSVETEIAKHKQEQARLSKLVAEYQEKLQAIPVREQQIAELARDYAMSKEYYSQLLQKQLSAETATQLEIRQQGERFEVLDAALPAEKPSSPNRALINTAGCVSGLLIAIFLAIGREFVSPSIVISGDIAALSAIPVLEVIPVIETSSDRVRRRRNTILVAASVAVLVLVCCALVLYRRGFLIS